MSRSKDAASKLHEKHQTILADLLRDEDNKYCADCMAKGEFFSSSNQQHAMVKTFKLLPSR